MLPKNQRFERTTFPRKKPLRRLSFSWGSVVMYGAAPGEGGRVAVVVSKKVLRHAHDRNRAKRRLYEALASSGAAGSAVSFVVFPRREALTAPFAALVDDMQKAAR